MADEHENVAWKLNSHFFVYIVIIPTRFLCQMQANSSGTESLSTISKFRKRKKISSLLVYLLYKTWKEAFSRGSRAVTAKKCTKNVIHVQSCRFALSSCCFFWRSHCRRRRGYYLRYLVLGQEQNFQGGNWNVPADSIRNVFLTQR